MKKKYFVPKVEIIEIDSADLIATSPGVSDDPINPALPNLAPPLFGDNEDFG